MKKIIGIWFVVLFVLFITSCGETTQGVPSERRYINGVELICPKDIMHPATSIQCRVASVSNRSTVTANGLNIWIEDGATVTPESVQAIEAGMTKAINKSICKGYGREGGRALRLNDYTVAVLRATEFDSQGNPAYRWACGSYCGSEYDKGGYILVAGQMVAAGVPYGNIFAIPESRGKYDYTANGSEYELEHIILAWYDGALFEASKIHGGGIGHPIYSCTMPSDNLLVKEAVVPSIAGGSITPTK